MDSLRRKPKTAVTHTPRVLPAETLPRPTRPLVTTPPPLPAKKAQPEKSLLPTHPQKSLLRKKILLGLLGLFLCVFLFFGILVAKGITTLENIQLHGNTASAPTLTQKLKTLQAALLPGEQVTLRGSERGRINILLLGKAGEGLPGENLTDTIMLASIDTATKKVALLSLPRDLYIQDPRNGNTGKLNTFYQKGLSQDSFMEPVKNAITLVTGEPIDYFFIMDFAGFESIVDALGGITVEVPKDFYDTRYPGLHYSYETFELKKGWQRLDGKTALKYVRERHDDPEGDFGRAKRQQQVLQALKDKASSPGTYLNFFKVSKLFESVEKNVETDVTLPEMQSFYELSKTLDTRNITNQVVDAWKPESLLRVDHILLGGVRAFTLVPRTGNWEETRELAQHIFELDALAAKKEALRKEEASVLILDSGETLQSAEKLSRYIERELGIQAKVLYDPSLEVERYPAMLIARENLTKPYSFEELLKRLPVTRGTSSVSLPKNSPRTDFVLTMDKELAESFENADEYYTEGAVQEGEEASDFPQNY